EGLRRSRRSGGAGHRPGREPQLRRGAGEGHRGVGGTDRRGGEEGHVPGRGDLTMATEVQLPALSPTMTEGKIVKWLKKEGDSISSGEAIAEVETDKSNLEVEAFDDGVLLKILVAEGETAKVGAPIAVIGAKGEKVEASAAAPAPKAPAPSAPAPVPPKAAAKPSPAPPEERAQKPGGPGQVVPIRRAEEAAPSAPDDNGRLRASPLAKRMARDEGLDLAGVQGSGPSGRIVKRDVEAAIGQGQAAAVA